MQTQRKKVVHHIPDGECLITTRQQSCGETWCFEQWKMVASKYKSKRRPPKSRQNECTGLVFIGIFSPQWKYLHCLSLAFSTFIAKLFLNRVSTFCSTMLSSEYRVQTEIVGVLVY